MINLFLYYRKYLDRLTYGYTLFYILLMINLIISHFYSFKDYIILSATFELEKGNIVEMKKLVEDRKKKRILSQPLEMPNAGSVFRNPQNQYAGALIEGANLKGYNINGAEVSIKHANFIVNKGGAKGEDIISLIEKIKKEIKEKNNVELKLEQIIVK